MKVDHRGVSLPLTSQKTKTMNKQTMTTETPGHHSLPLPLRYLSSLNITHMFNHNALDIHFLCGWAHLCHSFVSSDKSSLGCGVLLYAYRATF